jgi:hypothetical protein
MKKLIFAAVLLLVAAVIFFPVLSGGTLMTSDDNIGHVADYKSRLPSGFLSGSWAEAPRNRLHADTFVGFAEHLKLFRRTFHPDTAAGIP